MCTFLGFNDTTICFQAGWGLYFLFSFFFFFFFFPPLRPEEKELEFLKCFIMTVTEPYLLGFFQNTCAVGRTNSSSSFFDRLEESITQVNRGKKLSKPEIHTAFAARIA